MGGKRMKYGFDEMLQFSKGKRCDTDIETIKCLLHGCTHAEAYECSGNDGGVDYVAKLRAGAEVLIDAKTRAAGCSRYWRHGEPELAIEKWSVMPCERLPNGQAGWTLDESKVTDMILYTFDQSDTDTAFLLPFQSLRIATAKMIRTWMKLYKVDVQTSHRNGRQWQSQAVLVPASVVISAMESTYRTTVWL
jgi:hypothetical protein